MPDPLPRAGGGRPDQPVTASFGVLGFSAGFERLNCKVGGSGASFTTGRHADAKATQTNCGPAEAKGRPPWVLK